MSRITLPPISEAFSAGGNRLCFIDPRNPARCIKVPRPERTPALRRAEKGFPKRFKPLDSFDENLEEYRIFQQIRRQIGEPAFELIPRCYDLLETNYGRGLCSELICDDDELISLSLKQYVWQSGLTDDLRQAMDKFAERWCTLAIPSRNLLLHNILVQKKLGRIERMVVIDGLGWPHLLPLANWVPAIARRKARSRIHGLYEAVEDFFQTKQNNGNYGYNGWMNDEQRQH